MADFLIGIRMADQSFYPILEEGYEGTKRLILTTVRENQNTVRIDLYKSSDRSIEAASYLGSMVIEDIEAAAGGEPEIEVIMGIDKQSHLNAVARNVKTDAKQRLQTSLVNMEEYDNSDVADFEPAEKSPVPLPGNTGNRHRQADVQTVLNDKQQQIPEEAGATMQKLRKRNPVGRLIFVIAGLLLIAGLAFLTAWAINHYNSSGPVQTPIEEYLSSYSQASLKPG